MQQDYEEFAAKLNEVYSMYAETTERVRDWGGSFPLGEQDLNSVESRETGDTCSGSSAL